MRFAPNPYRTITDGYTCPPRSVDPNCEVNVHGALFPGNPAEGDLLFHTLPVDANQRCTACHTNPFGAAGGMLGGVPPAQPTSATAAALFNGDADGSPHSDLKVPHLRNMYEKFGPVLAAPGDSSMPETVASVGYVHDGGIPDLFRFLSADVFELDPANQAREVRDLVSFMFHFPTGMKPAVGRQDTLPAGAVPTGPAAAILTPLMMLGDGHSPDRHCELTAVAMRGGVLRGHYLNNGRWVQDATGAPLMTQATLFQTAESPITFTCGTIGSGVRLGVDRDEDAVLDFDDCADGDAQTFTLPEGIDDLALNQNSSTVLSWTLQASSTGPSLRHAILGGEIDDLHASGVSSTGCVAGEIATATWADPRPDPPAGNGYFYLVRAENPCGAGDLGPGLEPVEAIECP
jgi:hypothetical protein